MSQAGGADDEPERTDRLDITEPAEAEIDAIYLWMQGAASGGVSRAHGWYAGLLQACQDILPMPYRNQAVPEYGVGARRMLYGKGVNRYIVLYRVIEPEAGDADEEGIVRVMHVYHGARRGPNGPAGGDD